MTPRDVLGAPPGFAPAPLPAQQLWQWQDAQRAQLLQQQGVVGLQEPRQLSLTAPVAKPDDQQL